VFDLGLATPLEDLHILVLGKTKGVPETERCLVTHKAFKAGLWLLPLWQGVVARASQTAAQRRVSVQGPVTPGRASEAVLEEHSDDGHHGQTSVRQLGRKLLFACFWVFDWSKETKAKVALAIVARFISDWLVDEKLVGSKECHDLRPSLTRHLGDGSQSVWDVSELEAELGRELSRKFEVFRSYVSHCRKHGDPAMLQLNLASALEDSHITV